MRLVRILTVLTLAAYAVAVSAYGLHAYETNPQYDNQGMRYAQEGIIAATAGTMGDYLLEERKYPLFYAVPFALTYEVMLVATKANLTDADLYLASRIVSIVFALGAFFVTWRLGKRMGTGTDTVLLLATSLLFLLFTSAIRPHEPVAFWTALAALCSLRAKERPTILRTSLAFACAAAAFATLQSGIFAFVFPLWAVLERPFNAKNVGLAAAWCAAAFVLALLAGYPFLLRPLFGLQPEAGIDLGHDVGLHFTLVQPFLILWQLLWSELFLLIAFAFALKRIVKEGSPHPLITPALLYVGLYVVTFIFHTSSAGRFFLPVFPMLALIGALALRDAPRWVRPALCAVVIIVAVRLTWLAAVPDTYADMADYLDTRPPYTVIMVQPDEFFPLDRTKLATRLEHAPLTKNIVLPDYASEKPPPLAKDWPVCHASRASRTTDQIVLLWNDTPLALWHLFEARALGPNMKAYCDKN